MKNIAGFSDGIGDSVMSERSRNFNFRSFDGGINRVGELIDVSNKTELSFQPEEKRIARGAGMSFSAASFNTNTRSYDMRNLSQIENLDSGSKTVTVGAGVSVGKLLEFLVSNGYYLPTLPGYPTITIGGCIAADVHGKNPFKDGTFANQIESFVLHHIDIGEISVSKASNSELFELTVGGCGLTGTILSVTLKIVPLHSRWVNSRVEPVSDIYKLADILSSHSGVSDFVVSWHDFNQTKGRFGSGFVDVGVLQGDVSRKLQSNSIIIPVKSGSARESRLTLTSESRGQSFLPLWRNLALVGVMNATYHSLQSWCLGSNRLKSVENCFFPNKFLRDLYFHGFGRSGLHEYQIILDLERFPEYIEQVHWWLSRNELPITMASGKRFTGESRYVRFAKNGICFALDFPRCESASRFLRFLDSLVVKLQAVPNMFKDSRMPPDVVAAVYPEYELFRSRLREFDPKRRYASELSERLAL